MERADVDLGRRTWTDLGTDDASPILLVPVGATEQHGPHLPLDTDTRLALVLARRAAAQVGADPTWTGPPVLVTPELAVTASGEHEGFPGTLSIGTEVMRTVIIELVRSADWAHAVVLVNGHGGNLDPVTTAVEQLRDERHRVEAWWPRVPGGDPHAGRTETSLLLALDPEVVRLDRTVDGPVPDLDELRAHGVRAASPLGVLGRATQATAEHGVAVVTALVEDLVATLARLANTAGRTS